MKLPPKELRQGATVTVAPDFEVNLDSHQAWYKKTELMSVTRLLAWAGLTSLPPEQPNEAMLRGTMLHDEIRFRLSDAFPTKFPNEFDENAVRHAVDFAKDKVIEEMELPRHNHVVFGVPDVVCEDCVIDWKTGHSFSKSYKYQIALYCMMTNKPIGYIVCIDTKKVVKVAYEAYLTPIKAILMAREEYMRMRRALV